MARAGINSARCTGIRSARRIVSYGYFVARRRLTRRAALALGQRAAWVSGVFAGRRTSINSARRAVFQGYFCRARRALTRRAALFSRAIFIARANINSARRTDISSAR